MKFIFQPLLKIDTIVNTQEKKPKLIELLSIVYNFLSRIYSFFISIFIFHTIFFHYIKFRLSIIIYEINVAVVVFLSQYKKFVIVNYLFQMVQDSRFLLSCYSEELHSICGWSRKLSKKRL